MKNSRRVLLNTAQGQTERNLCFSRLKCLKLDVARSSKNLLEASYDLSSLNAKVRKAIQSEKHFKTSANIT